MGAIADLLRKSDVAAVAAFMFALGPTGCESDPPAAPPRAAVVPADAMADPARGELLYRTACASCHSQQTHWRSRHRVLDWAGLMEQVTHWQSIAGQNWSAEEIEDVSAYLNRRFYDLPCPLPRCSAGTVGFAPHNRSRAAGRQKVDALDDACCIRGSR